MPGDRRSSRTSWTPDVASCMSEPSVTVIVVKDEGPPAGHYGPFTGPSRPYLAMTVPFVRDLRANGTTPEDAVERLKAIIRSYSFGEHRKLISVLSVPLSELVVEEVMSK